VPSWTRQLKAANEEYAALNAKYLETDGAKQFLAEQQTAIAAAAECEVASSEAEDEGEEEQSATIKRKRRAPKQKKQKREVFTRYIIEFERQGALQRLEVTCFVQRADPSHQSTRIDVFWPGEAKSYPGRTIKECADDGERRSLSSLPCRFRCIPLGGTPTSR
jgi:hypothetical protein